MPLLDSIKAAKEIRPTTCDDQMLARWVNDIDAKIAEVMGKEPSDNTFPGDRELLMPSPYEDIYVFYLSAMIDWYNQEIDIYQNDMMMFNQAYAEAVAWWRRTHKPDNGFYWRVI